MIKNTITIVTITSISHARSRNSTVFLAILLWGACMFESNFYAAAGISVGAREGLCKVMRRKRRKETCATHHSVEEDVGLCIIIQGSKWVDYNLNLKVRVTPDEKLKTDFSTSGSRFKHVPVMSEMYCHSDPLAQSATVYRSTDPWTDHRRVKWNHRL